MLHSIHISKLGQPPKTYDIIKINPKGCLILNKDTMHVGDELKLEFFQLKLNGMVFKKIKQDDLLATVIQFTQVDSVSEDKLKQIINDLKPKKSTPLEYKEDSASKSFLETQTTPINAADKTEPETVLQNIKHDSQNKPAQQNEPSLAEANKTKEARIVTNPKSLQTIFTSLHDMDELLLLKSPDQSPNFVASTIDEENIAKNESQFEQKTSFEQNIQPISQKQKKSNTKKTLITLIVIISCACFAYALYKKYTSPKQPKSDRFKVAD